jgi:hypothetical protein
VVDQRIADPLMVALGMKMRDVFPNQSTQMALAKGHDRVVETQPLSFETDLQHTIPFAEKRDHVFVFHAVRQAHSIAKMNWNGDMAEVYFRGGRSLVGRYGVTGCADAEDDLRTARH